jgi:hypothetical protein
MDSHDIATGESLNLSLASIYTTGSRGNLFGFGLAKIELDFTHFFPVAAP